jgi:polar amino acid transport system substrate-binding protein
MISRRRLTGGLLTGMVATPLLCRSTQAQQDDSVMARVMRTKRIRYGVVDAQPPYCWRDLESGAWRGFMVDLAADLAGPLGAVPQPVEATWGSAVLDVQAGKVDIFFGLGPSPERAKAVDFVKPLYQNAFALIARAGFDPTRWQELDDPAVRVAIEIGSIYDLNVGQLCPNATVLRLRTNNEALLAVQARRADCQIIAIILALTTLSRGAGLGHLVVPEPQFSYPTSGIVAKEPDPAWRNHVDGWIEQRRSAGDLRRLLIANLARVGVKPEDVPAQMLF